ncbi:unnamed protein product [Ilex paraguariensis]|uniref:Autophagy-related protein 18a n=1 Tax=Ilex paraguariensis TaxID=185542 RepID=A0ABC8T366_9AQUA
MTSTLSAPSSWSLPSSPNPNPNPNPNNSSPSPHLVQNPPSPSSHHQPLDSDQSSISDLTDMTFPQYSVDAGDEQNLLSDFSETSSAISSNPQNHTPTEPIPTLLHLSFNQDFGCFASGTDRGFRIYNCDPFREIFRRDFSPSSATAGGGGGGIGVVQMLFRCNILALVGGGPEPQYPLNKVMIWDDHQSRCIGELSFRSEVKNVRLRRDRIIVILLQKIFVYNFADLKLLHQIETAVNPKGLCEVSHVSGSMVLVCPGLQKGQVRVEHYASKRTKFIMAHDSRIVCLALTNDGRLLATASSKGTLVRVFNTLDGSLLQEAQGLIVVVPAMETRTIEALA